MNEYLFKNNTFLRLLSSLFLITIAIISIFKGGILLISTSSFLIFVISYEYINITENVSTILLKTTKSFLNIIIFGLSIISFKFSIIFYLFIFLLTLLRKSNAKRNNLYVLLGPIYLCLPFMFLFNIRVNDYGLEIILWFLFIVWSTDIFSFLFGKYLGGKKLSLTLSPNKTWSGLICGILLGTIISIICFYIKNYSIIDGFIYGFLLSIFTQFGDLFESRIKRKHSIKDSGSLIPGHGGFLDRLDGLLFSSILLYTGYLYYAI
jgi:phosphatidate cytidylyltransferase